RLCSDHCFGIHLLLFVVGRRKSGTFKQDSPFGRRLAGKFCFSGGGIVAGVAGQPAAAGAGFSRRLEESSSPFSLRAFARRNHHAALSSPSPSRPRLSPN